ncbi:hypothetical protein [Sphingomonas sp. S17]|uniref:hypothetical protein n=1 Tax=Sphingomonas sp. S17 TaxID=1007104 RepID=UPI0002DAED25|nr:hypothetical protein [Sphingomonas sp. S17]
MRGEVVFEALGQRWTLFLGTSARCAIEQQYDRGFFAVVADGMPDVDPQTATAIALSMSEGAEMSPALAAKAVAALRGVKISVLRDLAWHGMRKHHPEVTPDLVDNIIDDIGDDRFGTVIREALQATQAAPEVGDTAKPGKPRAAPRKKKPTGQR